MSVEQKIIRLAAHEYARLRRRPTMLAGLIEEYHDRGYVDTRNGWEGLSPFEAAPARMIHLDEFTLWLLSDREALNALCDAVTCGRGAREVKGAPHGQGFAYATYYAPRIVRSIAQGLAAYPISALQERFFSQVDLFRQAAVGHLSDAAILAYQQAMFDLVRAFYREASEQQEYVLELIV